MPVTYYNDLTANYIRSVLCYDQETGVFTNRITRSANAKAGWISGCINSKGYRIIRFGKRNYYANRLAWLYVHGVWPSGMIDHADRDTLNDRISNLRDATRSQNGGNAERRIDNTSGKKGVTWHKRMKRYQVCIQVNGIRKHLGSFKNIEAAAQAYDAAASKMFDEFARTNSGSIGLQAEE